MIIQKTYHAVSLLLIGLLIGFQSFGQKTFRDSTAVTCSYANGVATVYPSPITIPSNVAINATGNLSIKFKYTGDLLYSWENLTLYGENNYYVGQKNISTSCGSPFVSQNFSLTPSIYNSWINDGSLVFGVQSSSSVNNNCTFQSFTNTNFCAQIVVEIQYYEFPNDAGVTNFIVPTSSTSAGLQPIVVQGVNFGSNALSSVNIGWSVNGTSQTSKSITFPSPIATGNIFTDTIGNFNFQSSNSYEIKAWTVSPNNATDSLAANDTTTTSTCIGFSGNYTVGNSSATFKNLNVALDNLEDCGVSGPVTLTFVDSTFEWAQIITDSIPGYSSTNNLTIKGNGHEMYHFGSYSVPQIIHLNGAEHVTIDSLTFKHLSFSYGWGVWLSNSANYNTITNCFFDLSIVNTSSFARATSIAASQYNYGFYGADNANYNTFSKNTFLGGVKGVSIVGSNQYSIGARGNKIIDNNFINVREEAIYLTRTDSTEITSNDISCPNPSYNHNIYGVYSNYDYRLNIQGNYIHNIVHSSNGYYLYGFYLTNSDGGLGNEHIIANNIIEDCKGARGIYGLYNYQSNNVNFYHNTIRDRSNATDAFSYGIYDRYGYSSKYFNNLIEFDYANSSSTSYGIYLLSNSSNIDDDNNNIYFQNKTSTQYYGRASSTDITVTDWNNDFNRGNNNLEVNPLFINDSTHTPKSVSLNNSGATTTGVTKDFNGVTRNSPPDIGALEFTPPSNDLGLVSLNLPDSACGLNSAQVSINVGNFGVNSYTGFTGYFQVGNGTVYSQAFSSSMASGVISTFIFDSLASFPNSGSTYSVAAWIVAANDGDASNDTISGKLVKNITPDYITLNDSLWEDFSGNNTYVTGTFNNGWKATPISNYYWTIENYYTQSGSGPYYDHTTGNTSGRFAFVRTTYYQAGQEAYLESPCFEISDTVSNAVPVLSFWYHKYGAEMGDLVVQIKDQNLNWVTVDSIIGQTHFSYSDAYLQKEIDLSAYEGLSTNVRFKAVSQYGDDGDMTIDDIRIKFEPITCDSITNVTFTDVQDTSFDISWNSNFGSQITQIQYGLSGFALGNGTLDSTISNQYHAGGLTNLTGYDVYLRERCADGSYTPWAGPFSILTNNYCKTNLHSIGCAIYSSIGSVQLEQIQNINSGCNANGQGYSIYLNEIAELEPEESYSLSVTPGTTQRTYLTAWIDFNRDGSFNSSTEFIGGFGYLYNNTTPHVFTINVPQGVDTGLTMLRVRSDYYTTINSWWESCTQGTYGETEDYLIRLLPPPTCPKPKDLVAGYETNTSTRLSWNARGVGSSWEIEYGSGTFAQGNGTTVTVTDTNYVLTGLNAYSNYSYYVRSICGPGDTSRWSSPHTFNTYPYCYNGLHTLGCSQSTPYDVGLVQFNTINNSTNNCPPGSFSAFANLSTSVTPSLSYNLTVRTNNQATINMGVWIDFNNDGDFDDFGEFVLNGTSNTLTPLSGLITIPLNAIQGNTIMRVRSSNSSIFSSSSCNSLYYGETEDYTINILPAPTCPAPNNLGVNSITSNSANFYWTSIASGSKWLIQYDTTGFTLGNGQIDSSISTSTTLSGLSLFGSYDVYVKEICSASDSSSWTGPVTFNVNPYCTTNLYSTSSNCAREIDSVKVGSYVYYDQNEPCPSGSYHQMFSNPISVAKLGSYDIRVRSKTTSNNSSAVWIDWNGDGNFNSSDEFIGSVTRTFGGVLTANITVPITAKSGSVIMRVRTDDSFSIGTSWGCSNLWIGETMDFILDIQEPLGCVSPYALGSNFVSFTSANVNWTDYSNANLFEIEYDTTGYTFGTGQRIFSTDTFETIQNLAQNGYYDFYVRTICDTADTSAWSSSHTFTTFPYCSGDVTTLHSTSYNCYQKLTNFQLDTFIRDYSSAPCGTNSYSFEPTVIQVEAGSNVPVVLNGSSIYTSTSPAIGVWIDYNQDGDFDDNGEYVATASRYVSKPYSTNITIPTTASVGTTIMRVRTLSYTYVYSYDACDTYTFGETKDFVVDILPPPSCPKPYNLTLYGTPTSTAARIGFTSPGNGNAWEVKYDTSGFNPSNSGISEFWTTTIDSIRGLTPFTNYDVYVREICAIGDTSNWSSAALTFTTNPYCIPTYVYDCNTVNSYYINTITLNGTSIGHTGCSGNANNYSFYDLRNSSFDFTAGSTQNFQITTSLGYYGYAWVDWNKDGQFENSEGTYLGYGTSAKNFSLNIPSGFFGNLMVRFRISRYTLYNYDYCSYESYGETEDYLFYIEPEACPTIATVNLNSVTDSSATIGWTQASIDSNTVFNIWVRELGVGLDTIHTNVTQNPYTVNGLNSSTQYSIAVQNNCTARGDSLSSINDSTIATTDCAPFTANYHQDFEGSFVNGAPLCWEIQDYSFTPGIVGATSIYEYSGAYGFFTYRAQNTSGNYASYLVSPIFTDLQDGDKQLRLFARSSTIANTEIIVGTTKDYIGSDVRFNPIDTIRLTNSYQQYFIDLSKVAVDDNRISLRFSMAPYNYIYLDDINYETQPSCGTPLNLNVVQVTNNTAVIEWDSIGSNNYLLSYGNSFLGISGIPNGTLINKTTNRDTLTGLISNFNYQVAVQQVCQFDSSFWNGPVYFSTTCAPDSAPFIENFTSTSNSSLPTCWSQPNTAIISWYTDNFGTSGITGPYYDGDGIYGGKYVYLESSFGSVSDSGVIFTQPIATHNLTNPYLYFDYHAYGSGIGTFKISISEDYGNTWKNVFSISGQQHTSRFDYFDSYEVNLKNYKNKVVLFRITGTKQSTSGDIAFDNFKVDEAPPCGDPYSLAVSNNIYGNNVDISWEGSDSTLQYKINYALSTFNLAGGTVLNNGTSKNINLSGLTSNTNYRVYVKSICATDSSDWIGPLVFTTSCLPQMAPISEDFGLTYSNPPSCWSIYSSTSENWYFAPTSLSAQSAHSGNSYAYINDNNVIVTSDYTLETPTVIIDTLTTPVLTYWYWSANNSGRLRVQALQNGNWVTLQDLTKSTNRIWEEQIVDLSSIDDTTRIRFIGSESPFNTDNYQAIDLVEIKNGKAADISVDGIFASSGNCGTGNFTFNVQYENRGINATTGNLKLVVDDSLTYYATISLNALSASSYTFSNLNLEGGTRQIKAYFEAVTGDNNRADDSLTVYRFLKGKTPITVMGDSTCSTQDTVTLSASGASEYLWYENSLGTIGAGTGNSIQVSNQTASKTYYVKGRSVIASKGGLADNTTTTVLTSSDKTMGLIFDVYAPIKLDSLTVYPNGSGNIVITIKNKNGFTVGTKTVNTPYNSYTPQRIPIGINLPAGEDYKITLEGTTDITWFRSSTNLSTNFYPVTDEASTFSITSSTEGDSRYHYFYDWKVSTENCFSDLTPVTAYLIQLSPPTSLGGAAYCEGETLQPLTATGDSAKLFWYESTDLNTIVGTGNSFTPSSAVGTRTYRVREAQGNCFTSFSDQTVVVKPKATASITADTTICEGQTVRLYGSGGTKLTWSNGSNLNSILVGPSSTTTYSVIANNQNGCKTDTAYSTVTVNPQPSLAVNTPPAICIGTSATLIANATTPITWSNGLGTNDTVTVSPSGTTSYSVTAIDSIGCSETKNVTVNVNPLPNINGGTYNQVCPGDTIQLTATGGVTYIWNGIDSATSIDAIITSDTTFSVKGFNNFGCENTDQVSITLKSNLDVNAGNDTSISAGNSVNLSPIVSGGSGNYTYLWSPDSLVLNANSANTSTIALTKTALLKFEVDDNNNGCSAEDFLAVNIVGGLVTANPTSSGNNICAGDSIQLFANAGGATGNYTYNWSPGSLVSDSTIANPIAYPSANTVFSVAVAEGASNANESISIVVRGLPFSGVTADTATCLGEQITLRATGGTSYQWSNGVGLDSTRVSPLFPATYKVTVTGNNGCKAVEEVFVDTKSLPTPSLNGFSKVCIGDSVTLTASGASAYLWQSGEQGNTETFIVNSPTNFSVTGIGSNGCSANASFSVAIDTLPHVDAGANQNLCSGDTATLTANGALTYNWSNNANTQTTLVSPSSSTTYFVYGTDVNGCTGVDSVSITLDKLPTVSAGNDTAICIGDTAKLLAKGGTFYFWNNGSSSANNNVSPTATSSYIVTVADANGCYNFDTVTVTVNQLPNADAGSNKEICLNETVTLTATGGSSYAWSNGGLSNSTNVSPSATSVFEVTVTDNNSCVSTDSVIVKVNALPIANAGADVEVCYGDSAQLSASGGSSYAWSGGGSTAIKTVYSLSNANYTVTVTDTNNCSASDQVQVIVNALPNVDAGSDTTICSGIPASLTASGAQTYSWSNGDSLSTILVNPSTTQYFSVIGIDSNGCSNVDSARVFVNQLPTASASNDTAICIGDNALLNASGGLYYFWNNGTGTAQNIVAPTSNSDYIVTVADGNGCFNFDTVSVTVNNLPIVDAGLDTSICLGDQGILTATGGATNFDYQWSSTHAFYSIVVNPTSDTKYYVTATDDNGCKNSDSVEVIVNPLPTANAGSDQTVCFGDTAILNASGGNNYFWNNNVGSSTNNVAPTSTSNFVVTVSDQNGCTDNDTVTVYVNSLPNIQTSADTFTCWGAQVPISAIGANLIIWSTGDTSSTTLVGPTVNTTYYATGIDGNGCVNTDSIEVTVNSLPTISTSPDTAICIGDTAELRASGGLFYFWNNGAQSATQKVNPAQTTSYIVTVASAAGCFSFDTVEVVVNSLPQVSTSADTSICLGETAQLQATGGVNYLWSNGSNSSNPFVTPQASETFSVTITDQNNCSSYDSVHVNIWALPTVNAGIDQTVCEQSQVTLSATGNGSFVWSNGDSSATTVFSALDTNNYIVTITDSNNCKNFDTTTVYTLPLPVAVASADTSICLGDTANISAAGGQFYFWNNGGQSASIDVSPAQTSTYIVTVVDGNNCFSIDSMNVNIWQLPNADAGANDTICIGDQTTLTATGGVSYVWNTNAQTASIFASPTQTTTYSVTVTDVNGCVNSDVTDVIVNALPIASAGADQTICLGDTATLSASGGTSYLWSNNGNGNIISVSPSQATLFAVTVTDNNNCSNTDSVNVFVNALPVANAGSDTSVCWGSSVTLNATGGVSYLWSNNVNTASNTVSPTVATNYIVTVTNALGCENTDTVLVGVNNLPNATVTPNQSICLNDSVTLTATGGLFYFWNSGQSTSSIKVAPGFTSNYIVTVADANGCFDIDTTEVTVNPVPSVSLSQFTKLCDNGPAFNLTGGVPSGGVYGGTFVNNGQFLPSNSGAGSFPVYYKVTNSFGCSDSVFQNINVNAAPNVVLTSQGAVCIDAGNIGLTGGTPSGGIYTGANVSGTTFNPSAAGVGTHVIGYTYTDAQGCSNQDTATIVVNPLPEPDLGNDTTICLNIPYTLNPGNFVTYQWSNAATTPTLSPTKGGIYAVTVTDANGCSNTDEVKITIDVCPNVDELSGEGFEINYYPNPASTFINLEIIGRRLNDVEVQVTNLSGSVLLSQVIPSLNSGVAIPIDVSKLATGVYFIRLTTEKGIRVDRITIN